MTVKQPTLPVMAAFHVELDGETGRAVAWPHARPPPSADLGAEARRARRRPGPRECGLPDGTAGRRGAFRRRRPPAAGHAAHARPPREALPLARLHLPREPSLRPLSPRRPRLLPVDGPRRLPARHPRAPRPRASGAARRLRGRPLRPHVRELRPRPRARAGRAASLAGDTSGALVLSCRT